MILPPRAATRRRMETRPHSKAAGAASPTARGHASSPVASGLPAAAAAGVLPLLARPVTVLAAFGLLEALLAVELLLARTPDEVVPAVGARQVLVVAGAHLFLPFSASPFAGASSWLRVDIASGIKSRKCSEALPPADASALVAGRIATTSSTPSSKPMRSLTASPMASSRSRAK